VRGEKRRERGKVRERKREEDRARKRSDVLPGVGMCNAWSRQHIEQRGRKAYMPVGVSGCGVLGVLGVRGCGVPGEIGCSGIGVAGSSKP
jgi:hypothetical protein